MHIDPFSGLDLVVALDVRNVEAHLTGAVENCAACTTVSVSGPHVTCPAGRAIETAGAAPYRSTATEIIDRLAALQCPTAIGIRPRRPGPWPHAGGEAESDR